MALSAMQGTEFLPALGEKLTGPINEVGPKGGKKRGRIVPRAFEFFITRLTTTSCYHGKHQ